VAVTTTTTGDGGAAVTTITTGVAGGLPILPQPGVRMSTIRPMSSMGVWHHRIDRARVRGHPGFSRTDVSFTGVSQSALRACSRR
jgi:hypothetical protein